MRRLKDLVADHTSDLGGQDHISHSERVLIRRAAMLTLQCELMERNWVANHNGQASTKQLEVYQRATGALRRTLESLGLQRRPRDVSPPTLRQYLEARANGRDDDDVEDDA